MQGLSVHCLTGHSKPDFGLPVHVDLLPHFHAFLTRNRAKPSLRLSTAADLFALLERPLFGFGEKLIGRGSGSLVEVLHAVFNHHSLSGNVFADDHESLCDGRLSLGGPVLHAVALEGERGTVGDDVVDDGFFEVKTDVVAVQTLEFLEGLQRILYALRTEGVAAFENVGDVGDSVEYTFATFAN